MGLSAVVGVSVFPNSIDLRRTNFGTLGDRVRRGDGGHRPEELATEHLALRSESAALVVSEPKAPPFELLFQDAVLFDKVIYDLCLMLVQPASAGREQEL